MTKLFEINILFKIGIRIKKGEVMVAASTEAPTLVFFLFSVVVFVVLDIAVHYFDFL